MYAEGARFLVNGWAGNDVVSFASARKRYILDELPWWREKQE
jgi:hypothetical protein